MRQRARQFADWHRARLVGKLGRMNKIVHSPVRSRMRACLPAALVLAALVFGGCGGPTVYLNSDHFRPQFDPGSLSSYRGKAVLLRGFENVDQNTTIFTYPRSGPRRYGGPALTSYFWYCFRTGFEHIGLRVFEEGQAPANIPVMDVKLVRLGEDSYTFAVRLLGGAGQMPLDKQYTASAPPVTSQLPADLEARAYRITSDLILQITMDPQFQAIVASAGSP